MNLLSLFRSNFYKPLWRYKVRGQLWRILFSHGDYLAGEDRVSDRDKKEVRFFCLHRITGEVMWEGKRVGDEWWTTLEGVYEPNVYLHAYAKPDLPNPKHITSIDIKTGAVRWNNPDLTFQYIKDNKVIAEKKVFERTEYFRLDEQSGRVVEKIADVGKVEQEKMEVREKDPHTKLLFPQIYHSNVPEFQLFEDIIGSVRQVEKLVNPIEIYSHGRNLIVCYHKMNNQKGGTTQTLSHIIEIYSREDKKLLYRDTMYANAAAPVPDGFFLRDNILYYIKEKSELIALKLEDNP